MKPYVCLHLATEPKSSFRQEYVQSIAMPPATFYLVEHKPI